MLLAKQGHQKVIFEAKLGWIFSRMQVLKRPKILTKPQFLHSYF